jgi:8-oxo-dGTP pyrophosphatase MutT (NUDIX family)
MADSSGNNAPQRRLRGRRRRAITRLRTVQEHSAGGLVVDGLDRETQVAVVIGKTNRHGHICWTLPKGHIEVGEKAEQTAIREIAEETGIRGDVLAALGRIDYWFRAEDHVVHKKVDHYLLRFVDGEPSAGDHEVCEVAWVPVDELASRLTYADERKLAEAAARLIGMVRTQGATALPPLPHSRPRRRPQAHSIARHHGPNNPDGSHNIAGPGRPWT